MMGAFEDVLTATAAVYRNADGAGMVAQGNVSVMPLMPVAQELIEQLNLEALRKPWQTFCGAEDIQEGDRLEIATVRYYVRWVGAWPWAAAETFLHVVVEESQHT